MRVTLEGLNIPGYSMHTKEQEHGPGTTGCPRTGILLAHRVMGALPGWPTHVDKQKRKPQSCERRKYFEL